MTSPQGTPDGRSLTGWGTRAQVVVRTTQKELTYRWTAPRSRVARVLTVPLLVGATLLVLALGLLAAVIALVAAFVAAVVFAVVAGVFMLTLRLSRWRHTRR